MPRCTRCAVSPGTSPAAVPAAGSTSPPTAASRGSSCRATACPAASWGASAISVSGADSNRVYALIEAKEGGLYRSDDAGKTWTRVNDDERYRQRAWYFTHVFADPKNADTVYVLNTGAFRSTDGGKTFELLPAPHGDHHGLWIDPTNPQAHHQQQRRRRHHLGGRRQDLDPAEQPANRAVLSRRGRQPLALSRVRRAAGQHHRRHRQLQRRRRYRSPGLVSKSVAARAATSRPIRAILTSSMPARMPPSSRATTIAPTSCRTSRPIRIDTSGNGADVQKYRFQWTEPVYVSHYDSNVIYSASQYVLKTDDRGHSWKAISPDLTRNDKSKQKPSGGDITLDITSVEYYDTVFALAESPLQKGMLWAGTDDGLIQLTRDDGKTWEKVTPADMPEWSMVSIIEASPPRCRQRRTPPLICTSSTTSPRSSTRRTTTARRGRASPTAFPLGAYTRSVREDPKVKGLLYAGTETGVYFSIDDGAHWQSLQLNLPTTPVHDLARERQRPHRRHSRPLVLDSRRRQPAAAGQCFTWPPTTSISIPAGDGRPPALSRPGRSQASRGRQPAQGRDRLLLPEVEAGRERRDHARSVRCAGQARAPSLEPAGEPRASSRRSGPIRSARRTCCPPMPA